MRLEIFDRYFGEFKSFWYVMLLSLIGIIVCAIKTDIELGAILCMFIFGGIAVGLMVATFCFGQRDRLLLKRIEHDRVTLTPHAIMEYNDFDDDCAWTIVKRHMTWGDYDSNGIISYNLMNRRGRYLLGTWCYSIRHVDINRGGDSVYDRERVYVISYGDGSYNLIYCHGYNLEHTKIVFNEPIQSFGDLNREYIKITYMGGEVNYVRLSDGDELFKRNLLGVIK